MDLEDEILPLSASPAVSVAPPSTANCQDQLSPPHGPTLQVFGFSSAHPTDEPSGSSIQASTFVPPVPTTSGGASNRQRKKSKKSVKGTNSESLNNEGPRKQKLQLEREELLKIEQKFVKKVASSAGLAGFIYQCGKCEQSFRIRLRCLDHARNCGEQSTTKKRKKSQRKLVCNVCDQVAYTRAQLQQHRKLEHSNLIRRHRCTRCQKLFLSSKSYCRHVKQHSSSATFVCPVAGPGLPVPHLSDMLSNRKHHRKILSFARIWHPQILKGDLG